MIIRLIKRQEQPDGKNLKLADDFQKISRGPKGLTPLAAWGMEHRVKSRNQKGLRCKYWEAEGQSPWRLCPLIHNGRDGRIWTAGPLLPRQVRWPDCATSRALGLWTLEMWYHRGETIARAKRLASRQLSVVRCPLCKKHRACSKE